MAVRGLLWIIILAELVVLYALLHHEGWIYDDNGYLSSDERRGFSWAWLDSVYFQHWGIGYRFMFALIRGEMPLDHRWALGASLVLLGGAIYLFQRVLATLFDSDWVGLAGAAYLGLAVLFIRAFQWFSAGLQYLPTTFCDLLCLYAYLRFQSCRAPRWALLSGMALAAGLLFYEKPVYMLLYLCLIRILLLSDSLAPRKLLRSLSDEWLVWFVLLGVTAVWAVGYRSAGGGSGLISGHVTLSQGLDYFRIMWVDVLVPAAVGVVFPLTLSTGDKVIAGLLQLATLALIIASLRRGRRAWRGWLALLIAVLATGLLVLVSRVAVLGLIEAKSQRYLVDFTWLVPLFVASAFLPRARLSDRSKPGPAALPRRRTMMIACLLLAAYIGLSVNTVLTLRGAWPGASALNWETDVTRTLAAVKRTEPSPVLADGLAPFVVVQAIFAPADQLDSVIRLYSPGTRVDGVVHGSLWTLASDGVAERATVGPRIGASRVDRLLAERKLLISGPARWWRAGSEVCVRARGPYPAQITRTLRPAVNSARAARAASAATVQQLTISDSYYLWVQARAGRDATESVYVDDGAGWRPAADPLLAVSSASSHSIEYLGSLPSQVMVKVDPGQSICLTSLGVARLRTA